MHSRSLSVTHRNTVAVACCHRWPSCMFPSSLVAHAHTIHILLHHPQAHPAAPHQAMLARFHAAMAQIRGWRLLIRRTPPAAQQSANTVAAESHSLSHDAVQQHLSSSSQPQQQQDTKKSGKQSERLVGWPQLLRWGELRSGKVWAIGCVEQQQKEQSCWVRFNLPGELKVELGVSEAVAAGKLVSIEMWCKRKSFLKLQQPMYVLFPAIH